MALTEQSITALQAALGAGTLTGALTGTLTDTLTVRQLAQQALDAANSNASHNTYLWRDPAWTLAEADIAQARITRGHSTPLTGIPVSLKDCFDLAGSPTSCGTHFYATQNGIRPTDSWLAARLRALGAVLTGKSHLHPLAYGITGENPDYGDCLQPADPRLLTGGSSSGAAASVQEGSAVAAIGTDTGGSIRVPAALTGLVGFRTSLGVGQWVGGAHLAPSFDTIGWLFRHLEDAPILAAALDIPTHREPLPARCATVPASFLQDCDTDVAASFERAIHELEALGISCHEVDVNWWSDAQDIFAPIQAAEAAALHQGYFDHFEASIAERLAWGASLSPAQLAALRQRHHAFAARMATLLDEFPLLMLPAAPVASLLAHADHSHTRARLLRYTTPVSLAGLPALTVPYAAGGMQIAAARNCDHQLLSLAAALGKNRASSGKSTRDTW